MADTGNDFSFGGFDGSVDSSDADDNLSLEIESPDTELMAEFHDEKLYNPADYEEELMDFSYEKEECDTVEDQEDKFNNKGEKVSDSPDIEDESFLKESDHYAETGIKIADYGKFGINADENGFDKSQPIEQATLEKGTVICRWGNEHGYYFTSEGTQYDEVSLPYKEETFEFHKYEVVSDLTCTKGKAAPDFYRKGGGDQFLTEKNVRELIDSGFIRPKE